jgi:XTP/dITP diphosphohydrolase
MIGRHPHVFGDSAQKDALNIQSGSDVSGMWDELKKADKSHRTSVLDGIPQSMPALALADKVLGKAEKIGILDADAPAALALSNEEELGGVLLAIVTSARANGLDAERALRTVLRELQDEIRDVEKDGGVDAGIIGMPAV